MLGIDMQQVDLFATQDDHVALIRRKRGQMMIHSFLYYQAHSPIWSDDKWQEVANELVILQKEHGATIGFFDELFQDWTGDTGMHLCNEYAKQKAYQLIINNPHCRGLGVKL